MPLCVLDGRLVFVLLSLSFLLASRVDSNSKYSLYVGVKVSGLVCSHKASCPSAAASSDTAE